MSLLLSDAGILRLGMLRIDDQPAASFYNLRLRDQEYLYSVGMDPRYAKHSPGSLLQYSMISQAIKDGVRIYDFGTGNEQYKSWWTNATCQLFEIMQARSRIDGLIWRNSQSLRNAVYRKRLIKQLYLTTLGRFQNSLLKKEDAP